MWGGVCRYNLDSQLAAPQPISERGDSKETQAQVLAQFLRGLLRQYKSGQLHVFLVRPLRGTGGVEQATAHNSGSSST